MDGYGDNRELIADCVDEIQPFIDEVLDFDDEDEEAQTEERDVVIWLEDFM